MKKTEEIKDLSITEYERKQAERLETLKRYAYNDDFINLLEDERGFKLTIETNLNFILNWLEDREFNKIKNLDECSFKIKFWDLEKYNNIFYTTISYIKHSIEKQQQLLDEISHIKNKGE